LLVALEASKFLKHFIETFLRSLTREIISTKTRGAQMSPGLRGVTPGIVEMMATMRKYKFASLLYCEMIVSTSIMGYWVGN
jgi:hypothetical protein